MFLENIRLNVAGNLRNETDFNYNKLNICPIAQVSGASRINSRRFHATANSVFYEKAEKSVPNGNKS